MSHLMYNPDGGFTHIYDDEMEAAVKAGWVPGEAIRQQMIAAKKGVAKPVEKVTMPAQPEVVRRSPGRPRNVVPSILNDGEV